MDAPISPYHRLLATNLHAALRDTPVVCLLGPRQCGKTTLARTLAPEYAYLSLDDEATLAFARTDPTGFVVALPDKVVSNAKLSRRATCWAIASSVSRPA